MVGIFKSCMNVFNENTFYVIRHDKSVYDYSEIPFLIGYVTVATGRLYIAVFIIYATRKAIGNIFFGKRLRPTEIRAFSVEIFGGTSGKVMVKIAAANDVISLFVLLAHIVKKHSHLRCSYFIASAVRRCVWH